MYFNWKRRNYTPMETNENGISPSSMPTLWDEPKDNQTNNVDYKGRTDPFDGYTHSQMHQSRGQNQYGPLNSAQSKPELPGSGHSPKPGSGLLLSNQDYFKPGNSTQDNIPDSDGIGSDYLPSHRGLMLNFDWRTKVEREKEDENKKKRPPKEYKDELLLEAEERIRDLRYDNVDSGWWSEDKKENETKEIDSPPALVSEGEYPAVVASLGSRVGEGFGFGAECGFTFVIDMVNQKVHMYGFGGLGPSAGLEVPSSAPSPSVQAGIIKTSKHSNLNGLGLEFTGSAALKHGVAFQFTSALPHVYYNDQDRKEKKYATGWAAGYTQGTGAGVTGLLTYSKHVGTLDFKDIDKLANASMLFIKPNHRSFIRKMIKYGQLPMREIESKIKEEIYSRTQINSRDFSLHY